MKMKKPLRTLVDLAPREGLARRRSEKIFLEPGIICPCPLPPFRYSFPPPRWPPGPFLKETLKVPRSRSARRFSNSALLLVLSVGFFFVCTFLLAVILLPSPPQVDFLG